MCLTLLKLVVTYVSWQEYQICGFLFDEIETVSNLWISLELWYMSIVRGFAELCNLIWLIDLI